MATRTPFSVANPAARKEGGRLPLLEYLEQSRTVAGLIFVVTVAAIAAISYLGLDTLSLPVQPNQLAQIRVTASSDFSYESPLATADARVRLLARVPPVYQLDLGACDRFEQHVRALLADLAAYEKSLPRADREYGATAPRIAPPPAVVEITERFNAQGPYRASPEDVARLRTLGDATARSTLVERGLEVLREVCREGVHDAAGLSGGGMSLLQLRRAGGEISEARVLSLEEALTYLRVNVVAEGTDRELSLALFRLLRQGVAPNLVFDTDGTAQLRTAQVGAIKPVVVAVERGQAIIEPGSHVTPAQYEMLQAYRHFSQEHGGAGAEEGPRIFARLLLVLAMVLASVIYIRIEDRETLLSNTRLGLLALVVILNLALVRLTYELASLPYFLENFSAAALLPYIAPTALAPLVLAILIDAGSAIFMALLVSIFTSVIYGNRLDLLVLTFLASLAGIFFCRDVRRRTRIVQAAGLGGLVVACFALLIGLVEQTSLDLVLRQMVAGLTTGVATGLAVAGLLPVLEFLFKRTTDITLLQLSDHNHPLLRLMQMEAPGTYHHSLVVAQLAEDAAHVIGANPLLCRVCALFHDIGKTAQPGHYIENQLEGANPHDQLAPAHSAGLIREHVTDGVELARRHRLPKAVADVIRQHHGTTLIHYFFRKARAAGTGDATEAAFRYPGPRPQFKESAIIFLADPVEAATRSLRTVGASQLGELIDRIFAERVADGQLDEAPLTFEEFAKLKTSFTFTLLNMLHSRVAYAAPEAAAAPAKAPVPRPSAGERAQ